MPIMYSRLCRRVVAGSFPVARRVAASDGMASMVGEMGEETESCVSSDAQHRGFVDGVEGFVQERDNTPISGIHGDSA